MLDDFLLEIYKILNEKHFLKERPTNHPVFEYFSYEEKYHRCICNDCGKTREGCHVSNLMKHLEKHPHLHKECLQKVLDRKAKKAESNQPTITGFLGANVNRIETITIQVDPDKIIDSIVDLITINGLPLSFVEFPAFKALLDPICQAMSTKMTINRRNIRDHIKKRAEKERAYTRELLRNKLVCLKYDFTKEILGVNAQIIHENKIIIRALSMSPLFEKHSGVNTMSHILNILKSYDVPVNHVYTSTTDNARNMQNCVKLLHDEQNSDVEWYEEYFHPEDCTDCENEDWDCQPVIFEMSDSGICEKISCAPHSYELGVRDFWDAMKCDSILTKSREAVKTMRTPTFISLIKQRKFNKPILDVCTRWVSSHNMLKRLVNLKEFCQSFEDTVPELNLSEFWDKIENLVDILEPAKEAMLKFQNPDLILPEFYKIWMNSILKLEKCQLKGGSYAGALKRKLEARLAMILSKPMLAALYLHPKYV
jgi:hypothetical protein